MSASSFESAASANKAKALLLVSALVTLLVGISVAAGYVLGISTSVLLPIAAVAAVTGSWVSWWKSDAIVLRLTRARVVSEDQAPQLHNLVEEICIASGLPKPRIAIVDDRAPNAFATGRDPEHAVVAFTSGILELMDREELQGVTAHELAHVANRDTLVMTVAATTAGAVAVLCDLLLRVTAFGGSRSRNSNPVGVALLLVAMVLAPLAAVLLQSAVSRRREALADNSAVAFTRNPTGLRRALEKLAADSTVVEARSQATAHLWIESPLDGKGVSKLFATHPPIGERIEALRAMEFGS